MSRLPDFAALKAIPSLTRKDKAMITDLVYATAIAARLDELHLAEMALLRGDLSVERLVDHLVRRQTALRAERAR